MDESERLVAAYFHAMRSEAKKARRMSGDCPVARVLVRRVRDAARTNAEAERDAYEAAQD